MPVSVAAVRSVGVVEFLVSLQVQVALNARDRKYKPNLRTDTDDAGFERAQLRGAAPVCGELIVDVPDDTNLQLLGQKLRCGPIEVEIHAVGIVRRWILEIPGQSSHG